jgi:hypothetical protein
MRREIKDKLISAASVTLFFAAVRPSVVPKMWITVLLAFVLYEGILLGLAVSRDVRRANRRRYNSRYRAEDAARWAEEWFNPLREVKG